MFQNILVAIDGSPDADQALTQAIDLAESEHTRLTLFSAVVMPPAIAYAGVSGGVTANLTRDAEADTQRILRSAVERVPNGVSVKTVLGSEPVRQALMRQINRTPRSRCHGFARTRRAALGASRQREPLRAAPQSHPRADHAR